MSTSFSGRHWSGLIRKPEPLLVQKRAALEFQLKFMERAAEAILFELLNGSGKRPELRILKRDAAAHFIGHLLVVVAAFVEKQ